MAKRNKFNRANIPIAPNGELTVSGLAVAPAKVKVTGSFQITGSVTHTGSHSTHGSGSMFKLKTRNPGATIEMGMHECVFHFDGTGDGKVTSTGGFIPGNSIVHCLSFLCTSSLGVYNRDGGTGISAIGHAGEGAGADSLGGGTIGRDNGQAIRGNDFYFSASYTTGTGSTNLIALNHGDTFFVYPNASGSNFYTGSRGPVIGGSTGGGRHHGLVIQSGSNDLTGSEVTVQVEPSTITGSLLGVCYFTRFGPAHYDLVSSTDD